MGRVFGLLHAGRGVEVGYRGPGLLNRGDGLATGRQVAQIDGHGLRCGRQCLVSADLGPRLELLPGGGVGPAGVLSLGVPEAGGDGLGRLAVATGQFQGLAELRDGGQIGGHGGILEIWLESLVWGDVY